MKKTLKYFLGSLFAIIVLTIIAIPFIPADQYRVEIEKLVTQKLGVNASIGDISFVSLPAPGIAIDNLKLTDKDNQLIVIKQIRVTPRLSSLITDTTVIRKIHLSGIALKKDDIPALLALFTSSGNQDSAAGSVHIKRITADDSIIQLDKNHALGPLQLDLELEPGGMPEKLALSLQNEQVEVNLERDGSGRLINIQASDWKPKFSPTFEISSLKANGRLLDDKLHLDKIRLVAYKGEATGNLILSWSNKWNLDSRFELSKLNVGLLLKAFGSDALDGTGSGKFTLRGNTGDPARLVDSLNLTGDAMISNGHIYDADLEQAVRTISSEWKGGGQTPFDIFKSQVDANTSRIKLRQITISSSILAVDGKLDIKNLNKLKGTINVGLNEASGLVSMPLMVAGTVDDPLVRPTNEALSGAAIGTSILGPGVGTAAGVKAGEFLGRIGSFFGSDEEEAGDEEKK